MMSLASLQQATREGGCGGEKTQSVVVWMKFPRSCCFLLARVCGCPLYRSFDRELVPVAAEHQPLKQMKKELGCRYIEGREEKSKEKVNRFFEKSSTCVSICRLLCIKTHSLQLQIKLFGFFPHFSLRFPEPQVTPNN